MVSIRNFTEAEQALEAYMPLAHEIIGKDISLVRMRPLMQAVGSPESRLKIVHVAGTSGKTSTAYYISALLTTTGKKVGLTVSPHMDTVAERVQLNGRPLDEETFCREINDFLPLVERAGINPTYYEVLMAFAYWYFDKAGVDYAVIETGLGGLHDGSNVAERPDKVCVITDIGYDHMHILGNTLPEIAFQKAGIIHVHNHVFMHTQPDEVMDVFRERCSKVSATLHEALMSAPGHVADSLRTLPQYKQRNWLLAYAAFSFIAERDELMNVTEDTLVQSLPTYIPGRMDEVMIGGKTVVMDGAHNVQKMAAFIESFKTQYVDRPAVVLFAVLQTKDYEPIIAQLHHLTDTVVCTSLKAAVDGRRKGADAVVLQSVAHKTGMRHVYAVSDSAQAFDTALAMTPEGGVLVISGSLYLLSEIRKVKKELQRG